jgi:glycosyltransferase involved in cell wall biosynthesis
MEKVLPVTVCIPVRNEARNLPGCLESLGDHFAEVVVVDSQSTDSTRAIAAAAGAEVLEFRWDGTFPKKRNWAIRNHCWKTPWVLFLDADERVTPAFVEELRRVLQGTANVGFWVSFTDWFMGKPMRHGDVLCKLALFRIGAGEYERFPEQWWSNLDMEVHEHPVLDGQVGELKARLEHHDYRGLHNYIWRHNEYSTWEANRFMWLASAGPEQWEKLIPRQRFKYRQLDKWWFAPAYFVIGYFVRYGFMDGVTGLRFASMKFRYFADVRLKIAEARRNAAAM